MNGRERVGGQAGAIQQAARRLDVLEHVGEFPADALEVGDRLAEHGAFADIVHRFVERALGQAQRNRRVQAALRVERGQQLAESVFLDHQVFQRQFAIVELDFVQVLAAHGVVGAGDLETLGIGFQQNAADALPGPACRRPG